MFFVPLPSVTLNIRIMEEALKKVNAILGTYYRNWESLSMHKGLTEDFIRKFEDIIIFAVAAAILKEQA